MIDLARRDALIRLIHSQPEHESGHALVTISEFFDGNADVGSIGCNLPDHPGLECFRRVLTDIANRSDVEQVWLQIYDVDEGDWPFSENVLIVGNPPISEVTNLTQPLQPSEVSALDFDWVPSRAKHLSGRSYINLWWD